MEVEMSGGIECAIADDPVSGATFQGPVNAYLIDTPVTVAG
jgi:hypothetical protein